MAPLVSIVGTGGAGKTRVAIAVGMELLERFPDGVCFVELAPLNDASLVVYTLAAALRLQESPHRPLLTTILSYLADKRLLLILDNCEHVIGQVRRAAGSLLRDCPSVNVLITSREPLTIAGERVYRIPPLAVPDANAISPQEAITYGAVALFVDRVQAADARFEVTPRNVEPVVEICRRLDGLPLALELAAARSGIRSLDWQRERCSAAPSDYARRHRLELRAALIAGTRALQSALDVRGWVYPGNGNRRLH
jgi:non-specific serine/threonine protein kinase